MPEDMQLQLQSEGYFKARIEVRGGDVLGGRTTAIACAVSAPYFRSL